MASDDEPGPSRRDAVPRRPAPVRPPTPPPDDDVAQLRAELAEVRAQLARLRDALGERKGS